MSTFFEGATTAIESPSLGPSLDIVIVNWNSANQLRECLHSIAQADTQHFILSSVVVVDNSSTDTSMLDLPTTLPLVTLTNKLNRGFGAACNQGSAAGSGQFVLLLNPDTRLYADSLDNVMSFLGTQDVASIGICGIQLVDRSGQVARCCARFPSAVRFVLQGCGLDRLFPQAGHFMVDWDHRDTRSVDQVIGAFLLIRRSLFTKLGGFDERFFVYYEDLDLSYRAKALGWPTVYFSGATAFHAGGGTSDHIKATRLFYLLRSRIQYSFKHFHVVGAACVLLSTLSVELLARCLHALFRRSLRSFVETVSAYSMLIQWLLGWLVSGKLR